MTSGLESISSISHDVGLTDAGDSSDQFLTFMLAGEEYGVEILSVQEIRGWAGATKIPNMPAYVRGVINLRGSIVPIVDLRERFKLETVEYGPTTVVIVLRVADASGSGADLAMGLIVDAVSDVYRIGPDQLQPLPEFAASVEADVASRIATIDDKMIIVLDIAHLLSRDDFSSSQLQQAEQESLNPDPAEEA